MSRIVNRKGLEYAIWEWTPDMSDWSEVDCRLPFDLVNYDVVDHTIREWLVRDGFEGECFLLPRPHQENVESGTVVICILFENEKAAFNCKIRWG